MRGREKTRVSQQILTHLNVYSTTFRLQFGLGSTTFRLLFGLDLASVRTLFSLGSTSIRPRLRSRCHLGSTFARLLFDFFSASIWPLFSLGSTSIRPRFDLCSASLQTLFGLNPTSFRFGSVSVWSQSASEATAKVEFILAAFNESNWFKTNLEATFLSMSRSGIFSVTISCFTRN